MSKFEKIKKGWNIIVSEWKTRYRLVFSNEDTHEQTLSRETSMSFPLFFLGAGIVPEKVRIPVSIDQVAPTVAQALRIRAPNACPQAPLNY